jgi:hypothetical protein
VLNLTDPTTGQLRPVVGSRGQLLTIAAGALDLGTLLATDTLRRVAEVSGLLVRVGGVPSGWEHLNIRPGDDPETADVTVLRPYEAGEPPYGLEHRLAWLSHGSLADAREELASWRAQVAAWAEEPSKPMCAQVQQDVLGALCDDLDTRTAVSALRGSLALDLPPGCLFETWAWVDRMLALDLALDVGR